VLVSALGGLGIWEDGGRLTSVPLPIDDFVEADPRFRMASRELDSVVVENISRPGGVFPEGSVSVYRWTPSGGAAILATVRPDFPNQWIDVSSQFSPHHRAGVLTFVREQLGGGEQRTQYLWTEAGGLAGVPPGFESMPRPVFVADDASRVVFRTAGNTLTEWRPETGFTTLPIDPSLGVWFDLLFSPSGDLVAATTNQLQIGVFGWWHWTPSTGLLDLTSLVESQGIDFPLGPNHVSDDGLTLLSSGTLANGVARSFVITIPSPSSAGLLLGWCVVVLRRRRPRQSSPLISQES
jgi:hypothetical protein